MLTWWPALTVGLVLLGIYLVAWWGRPRTLPSWSKWRLGAWIVGTSMVVGALSPSLTALAHHDHRFHMGQHLLLGMYAPLALVLAAPVTLLLGSSPRSLQRVLTRVLRSRVVHVVSHPVTAAVVNVGGMFLLYLTPLYGASMAHQAGHGLVLLHFLAAGWLYAWAIAGPDPAPRRPGMATRVTVLIVAAGAHAFLAKFLYARAHMFAGHHGDASTMEAAAQWMYYGGDVAEILLAVMLFRWWYRRRSAGVRSSTRQRSELPDSSSRFPLATGST